MTFKDNLGTDLDIFFNIDEFATEIVYISQLGGTVNISGHVEYLDDLNVAGEGNCRKAIIFIKQDDVNVERMDRIWINSIEWKVNKIEQEDSQVAKLFIRNNESYTP